MNKTEDLYNKLRMLSESDYYPFHMPGHKRRSGGYPLNDLYRLDITEIDGFDNLHQPEGILRDGMESVSQIYGALKSYYLVNGSTCGILSAVCAAVSKGKTLLLARNSHKSAYHAVYLNDLKTEFLYPEYLEEYDIAGGISPEKVAYALDKNHDIQAVLITSPTYDGIISDIREIAAICHRRNVICIVDEAHGAHLGIWDKETENSCNAGADIVIHSIHKTLPAPTQTALLHVNGDLVDIGLLEYYLHIFQTSSPSYILLAGIEQCFRILEKEGDRLYQEFLGNRKLLFDRTANLKNIHVFKTENLTESIKKEKNIHAMDITKILLSVKGTEYSGKQLYDELLTKYHLQMEMAGDSYVTAIVTVMDTIQGFERLADALCRLDKQLHYSRPAVTAPVLAEAPIQDLTIYEARKLPKVSLNLTEAVGQIAGEFVNLYPPGIPIMVPGEKYTKEVAAYILNCLKLGYNVQGIDKISKKVTVSMI